MPKGYGKGGKGRGKGRGKGKANGLTAAERCELERCRKLRAEATNVGRGAGKGAGKGGSEAAAAGTAREDAMPVFRPSKLWLTDKQEDFILETLAKLLETGEDTKSAEDGEAAVTEDFANEDSSSPEDDDDDANDIEVNEESGDDHWEDVDEDNHDEALFSVTDSKTRKYMMEGEDESDDEAGIDIKLVAFAADEEGGEVGDSDDDDEDDVEIDGRPCARIYEQEKQAAEVVAREQRRAKRMLLRKLIEADRSEAAAQAALQRKADAARQAKRWTAHFNNSSGSGLQGLNPGFQPELKAGAAVNALPDRPASGLSASYNAFDTLSVQNGENAVSGDVSGGSDALKLGSTVRASLFADSIGKKGHQGPPKVAVLSRQMSLADLLKMAKGKLGLKRKAELVVAEWPRYDRSDRSVNKSSSDAMKQLPPHLHFEAYCLGTRSDDDAKMPLLLLPDGVRLRVIDRKSDADLFRAELKFAERSENSTRRLRKNIHGGPAEEEEEEDMSSAEAPAEILDGTAEAAAEAAAEAVAANEAALVAQAHAVKAHYAQDASNRRKRRSGGTSTASWQENVGSDYVNRETPSQATSDQLRAQRRAYFLEGAAKRQVHPKYSAMMAARAELPAWHAKSEVLDAVARSQVVVVCGATGCGKSTQIPQFLVDAFVEQQQQDKSPEAAIATTAAAETPAMASDGSATLSKLRPPRMVITQPRRVAALALAKRVADERCEQLGAGEVGYQVRLDRRVDRKKGAIEFVTVGVLLRRLGDAATANAEAEAAAAEIEGEDGSNDLESNRDVSEDVDDLLNGLTHIIVDEVHERDVLADFLLIVLRDLLATRPSLKLILMSATVDASRFADYFGNATPVVNIPGRTFPIAQKYLTDVKKMFPKAIPGLSASLTSNSTAEETRSSKQFATTAPTVVAASAALPPVAVPVSPSVSKPEAEASIKALGGFVAELIKQRVKDMAGSKGSDSSSSVGSDKEAAKSGRGATAAADVHGAILVFLPGAGEIDQAMRETKIALGEDAGKGGKGSKGKGKKGGDGKGGRNRDADDSPGWLLPLHGALPLRDQRRAFLEAAPHRVKVVFATNVAETSITIPDVDTVVDSGFVKEIRYDPIASLPKLETVWVSQAAAQQRSGRAGRVRPGTAYRMYDRPWFEGTSSSSGISSGSNGSGSGSGSGSTGGTSGGGSGGSSGGSSSTDGMLRYTVPEMVRTPLEELVLQTQLLELGAPNKFLSKALDPPERKAVNAAVRSLLELGALRIKHTTNGQSGSDGLAGSKSGSDGADGANGADSHADTNADGPTTARKDSGQAVELTSLGHHVARLPLAPKLAKLLVLGALFGVPEEALTIAACLSEKSAFVGPYDKRDEVRRAKSELAEGFSSDHVAALNAYLGWKHAAFAATQACTPKGKAKAAAVARAAENAAAMGGGDRSSSSRSNNNKTSSRSDLVPESPWQAQRSFCRLYWLSEATLVAVDQLREQYRRLLCNAGFIPPPSGYNEDDDDEDDDDEEDDDSETAAGKDREHRDRSTSGAAALASSSSSPSVEWSAKRNSRVTSPSPPLASMPSKTATLVTSLLAAALCPAGVARVLRPTKNLGGKRGGGSSSGGTCYTRTERVLMHPGSVNARLLSDASSSHGRVSGPDGFLCFFAKQATASATHPYLLDSSLVPPLAVLLFGGDLDVRRVQGRAFADNESGGKSGKRGKGSNKRHAKDQYHKKNTRCHVAVIGTGLAFEMPETAAVLVKVLRRALEEQLAASIAQPTWLNALSHHDAETSTVAEGGQLGQIKSEKAQRKAQLVLDATAEFLKLGTGHNN